VVSGPPVEVPLLGAGEEVVGLSEMPVVDAGWANRRSVLEAARQGGARVLLSARWAERLAFEPSYLVDLFDRAAWREVAAHLAAHRMWRPGAPVPRNFARDLVLGHAPSAVVPAARQVGGRLRWPPRDAPWYTKEFRMRACRPASVEYPSRARFPRMHARTIYGRVRSPMAVLRMELDAKVCSGFGLEAADPFLDRDVVRFLMAIPGEELAPGGVPYGLLGQAMGIGPPTPRADGGSIRRGWAEARGRILGGGLSSRYRYTDREELLEEMRYFETRMMSGDRAATGRLLEALGLELWLERFVG